MKLIKTLLFTVLFSLLISPAYADRNGYRDGNNYRYNQHDPGQYYKKRVSKRDQRSNSGHLKNDRRYRHDNGLHRGQRYNYYPRKYYNKNFRYGQRRGYSPWFIDNNGWGLSLFLLDQW